MQSENEHIRISRRLRELEQERLDRFAEIIMQIQKNSNDRKLPRGFIARYEGFCPICGNFIIKGEHMIVKMPKPIRVEGYAGIEHEAYYAHHCCYRDMVAEKENR